MHTRISRVALVTEQLDIILPNEFDSDNATTFMRNTSFMEGDKNESDNTQKKSKETKC